MSSTRVAPLDPGIPLESVRRLRLFESRDEKLLLAQQWEVVLEQFYVHLPLKERMLGVRPVQQARLLQEDVGRYPDDHSFMEALLRLCTGLRDFHTMIDLPEPWSRLTAFLPFQLHEYFDDAGVAHYVVGALAPGTDLGGDFVRGVEVTHWNGELLEHKVVRLGLSTAGANPAARRRRALESLTWRVLKYGLPPDEDFVFLTYLGKKGPADLKLPWLVREAGPRSRPEAGWDSSRAMANGLNEHAIQAQRLREEQFTSGEERGGDCRFPECLSFRRVETSSGTFGYLRIAHFVVDDVDGFVREVERIVRLIPETGLIIDVRGNPGGAIPAGERLLQLFTSSRIEPEPFSFRCTDFTRKLSESGEEWSPWRPSLRAGVVAGELFSEGFPLTPVEQANDVGRIYKGPVVLVCDALSYSATDVFIAGFMDHHIGKVIGVDTHTGAGGSSMYWHQRLVQSQGREPGGLLKPLARGAELRVALLRSTRVGAKRGIPVEGLGVEVDVSYRYTRDDVLHGDVDLLNRAGQVLTAPA
ncbi:S41 family peptidase [Pyxidicoccus sp. MSG2]|uniref:S41 family peptidase n=1 Tax=Pyxidicoccus sp. MSG2 TaxID=2996790 RepID=UPI00226E4881|nr:S41 family peptidase [Pyxidicoccus sp. MSG2]MCY1021347.1 S41 family peptidase [Pyxidicoccus sp. MSG2]